PLERGDQLVPVNRVELVVREPMLGIQVAPHARVIKRSERVADERASAIDDRTVEQRRVVGSHGDVIIAPHEENRAAMNRDLALALELADASDAITMRHFQSATLGVRTKSDRTPVSEADEAVERMIREKLATERPNDAIVGEEFGSAEGDRRWIIDPIDATKNYIRGIPVFATLIALENEAGVVSAPALHRRWWAARGEGAFCNERSIRVSQIATIEEASLAFDDVGVSDDVIAFFRRFPRARGFGDFWGHMLVAEGAVDVCFEPAAALWDVAAVKVIVEEAGGRFDFPATSTNGVLHDMVLEALGPSPGLWPPSPRAAGRGAGGEG